MLSKGLTMVGTGRKNKAFTSIEILPDKNKEVNSFLFVFQKNAL